MAMWHDVAMMHTTLSKMMIIMAMAMMTMKLAFCVLGLFFQVYSTDLITLCWARGDRARGAHVALLL